MNNILFKAYDKEDFYRFCEERETIRLKKSNGEAHPWTVDSILSTKKFCNIDRRHDKGTVLIYDVASKTQDDELKINGILTYRIFSSGSLIAKEIENSNSFNDFVQKFNLLTSYGKSGIPYQYRCGNSGYTYKVFFNNDVVRNSKNITNYVLSLNENNKTSVIDFIANINKLLDSNINRYFPVFQFALDIADLYPNKIDLSQGILYGMGSKNCLNKISKNTNIPYEELRVSMLSNFKYDETMFEHALCEYDKYSKFVLGIKKFESSSGNYKY